MPGYTAECMSGQHTACLDRDCRCGCHAHVQAMVSKVPVPLNGMNLVCPVCAKPGKSGDQFCRQDGTRLVQGKICTCGRGAEPGDLFCGWCGQKFGEPSPKAVRIPDLSEEEMKALEAKARTRPSDVEFPPQEIH